MNSYLKPESYLVLGCAESITGLPDLYEPTQFETASSSRIFPRRSRVNCLISFAQRPVHGRKATLKCGGTMLSGVTIAITCAFTWSLSVILLKLASNHVHPLVLNLGKNSLGLLLLAPQPFLSMALFLKLARPISFF